LWRPLGNCPVCPTLKSDPVPSQPHGMPRVVMLPPLDRGSNRRPLYVDCSSATRHRCATTLYRPRKNAAHSSYRRAANSDRWVPRSIRFARERATDRLSDIVHRHQQRSNARPTTELIQFLARPLYVFARNTHRNAPMHAESYGPSRPTSHPFARSPSDSPDTRYDHSFDSQAVSNGV